MSTLASSADPLVALQQQLDELRRQIEQLQKANPLNNASVDSGPGISAGSYQVSPAGVTMPWSGGPEPVHDVVGRVQGNAADAAAAAQSAMGRANQAYDAQALKPTTLWVQARLDALSGRIDGAAGSGTVDALAQRVASLEASRVQMVQLFSQIIVAMEVQPGHTRPTPIQQG